MVNDPRECVFCPSPTGKYRNCVLLDIPNPCTPERACRCSFGITPRVLRQSTLRAYERLASREAYEQSGIADKYYSGRMPWKESTNGHQKV